MSTIMYIVISPAAIIVLILLVRSSYMSPPGTLGYWQNQQKNKNKIKIVPTGTKLGEARMLYESVAECSHKRAADQIISWRKWTSLRLTYQITELAEK